jgi:cytochrome c556
MIMKWKLVATVGALLLSACEQRGSIAPQAQAGAQSGPPFILTATIKELMDSTVDPSADVVWGSVAVKATKTGVDEHKPRTDADWQEVRRSAITLMEAMNLLMMEGRHAAPAGTQPAAGELAPTEIDKRIAQSRPAFIAFAKQLNATAETALHAIDRKDADALFTVGGDIDTACEACHLTYWYPEAPR